jgi:hypothetical protein
VNVNIHIVAEIHTSHCLNAIVSLQIIIRSTCKQLNEGLGLSQNNDGWEGVAKKF